VLVGIAVLMTVGVYGLVAGIVKLDDLGLYLSRKAGAARAIGNGILRAAPWLMKTLSVVGTAAMFLVGGGILVHGIAPLHHAIEATVHDWPTIWEVLGNNVANAIVGIVAGAIVLAVVTLAQRVTRRKAAA